MNILRDHNRAVLHRTVRKHVLVVVFSNTPCSVEPHHERVGTFFVALVLTPVGYRRVAFRNQLTRIPIIGAVVQTITVHVKHNPVRDIFT